MEGVIGRAGVLPDCRRRKIENPFRNRNSTPPISEGSSKLEMLAMRNLCGYKLLKKIRIFVDCKSAYAGSIPTSASTLKNPVD